MRSAALLVSLALVQLASCSDLKFDADQADASSAGTAGTSSDAGALDSSFDSGANDAEAGGDANPLRFPRTPLLDDFNREDGDVGENWLGSVGDFQIKNQSLELAQAPCGPIHWHTSFGVEQEAFVTLDEFGSDTHEVFLTLKGQSTGDCDHMEVVYLPIEQRVGLNVCVNGSWYPEGNASARFVRGDQLGARALPNGEVRIFRNGTLLRSFTASDFPYKDRGGRIGVGCWPEQSTVRFDDFGGG